MCYPKLHFSSRPTKFIVLKGFFKMKNFIQLNVLSILYALMIFVPIQLTGNVYRISRLTSWNIDTVNIISSIVIIAGIIFGTILHFFLTKKWFQGEKTAFWTVILWIPYFIIFVYFIGSLIPITYEGDAPNPSTGLIAIGALFAFPFYLLTIHFISLTNEAKTNSK